MVKYLSQQNVGKLLVGFCGWVFVGFFFFFGCVGGCLFFVGGFEFSLFQRIGGGGLVFLRGGVGCVFWLVLLGVGFGGGWGGGGGGCSGRGFVFFCVFERPGVTGQPLGTKGRGEEVMAADPEGYIWRDCGDTLKKQRRGGRLS